MTQYEYKAVPFIGLIKSKQAVDAVSQHLTKVINANCEDGWEFYQMGDVNIEVQPGCIAGLFGAGASYMRFDQLIFRRPI